MIVRVWFLSFVSIFYGAQLKKIYNVQFIGFATSVGAADSNFCMTYIKHNFTYKELKNCVV